MMQQQRKDVEKMVKKSKINAENGSRMAQLLKPVQVMAAAKAKAAVASQPK